MMYFVYVLQNPEGRLYIGFTANLERRLQQHQEDKAGWTRGRGPWELVLSETFTNRTEAMRRERSLKRGKANHELRKQLAKSSEAERVLLMKD
jgi:putative endonuclease